MAHFLSSRIQATIDAVASEAAEMAEREKAEERANRAAAALTSQSSTSADQLADNMESPDTQQEIPSSVSSGPGTMTPQPLCWWLIYFVLVLFCSACISLTVEYISCK